MCTRSWDGTEPEETDRNWPKGYPIPYGFTLKNKIGRVGWGCCHFLGTDWALVNGWWAIALCITCFVYVYIYTITIILFFFPLYFSDLVFYLNLRVLRFFFFLILSTIPLRGVSERTTVSYWATCQITILIQIMHICYSRKPLHTQVKRCSRLIFNRIYSSTKELCCKSFRIMPTVSHITSKVK